MTMPRQKYVILGGVLALLLVVNLITHVYANWGLVTVKVHEVPLGQVIKSIERQGGVTIYSNIDPQNKISMYVDHVPVPEALETLAVNAEAQWRLAFFVASNSGQVKEEIRTFMEGGERSDDTQIYSFMTPLGFLGDDSTPVADPRKQVWPGLTGPAAPAPVAANAPDGAPAPEGPPTSMQGYLRAFAEHADIWIMAPAGWDPSVPTAPPASSSITSALDHFVGQYHGSVTHAFILRGRGQRVAGEGRQRGIGGGFRGGMMDWATTEDRMKNAMNGLPADARANALAQLDKENQFQKEIRSAPPDKRRQMFMQHMIDRRLDGDNNWRRSPEQRAKIFSRLVSNRMAAQGKG